MKLETLESALRDEPRIIELWKQLNERLEMLHEDADFSLFNISVQHCKYLADNYNDIAREYANYDDFFDAIAELSDNERQELFARVHDA